MTPHPVLVSHALCPYVQRVAILLHEKGVPFERRDVDLRDKPRWFLELSPLGRTPVLLAGETALFESAAICEYLEDVAEPPLHPAEPLQRAMHRAWMAVGSEVLGDIGVLYNAADAAGLAAAAAALRARLQRVEAALHPAGPCFAGAAFSVVDAVFAPAFRYFEVIDGLIEPGLWDGLPRIGAWRATLAARPSVRAAAGEDYPHRLRAFLRGRDSELGRRARAQAAAQDGVR